MAKKKKSKPPLITRRVEQEMEELFNRAMRLRNTGRVAEAYEVLRDRWKQFPDVRNMLMLVAELAADTKDSLGFIEASDRLAKVAPTDPDILVQRAYAYTISGM